MLIRKHPSVLVCLALLAVFTAAAVAMIASGAIRAREAYSALDGPVLILIAALIPVSDAIRATGGADLIAFGQKHNIKIGTISDLIAYRRRHDNLIAERAQKAVHSVHGGDWMMRIFADETRGAEHIVLSKGDLAGPGPVMVRMHALDPLHDVLGIDRDRAGDLPAAMRMIADEVRGGARHHEIERKARMPLRSERAHV
mgnify:CR=1 FL=1